MVATMTTTTATMRLYPTSISICKQGTVCCLMVTIAAFSSLLPSSKALAGEAATPSAAKKPNYSTLTIRGRVVWIGEALKRRFQIKSVPEAEQRVLVLESPQGEIFPLVEDIRGRSFRLDPRLRNIDVELLVRRYEGSPMVQVIRIYSLKNGHKHEMDYWCEICAIAMFELKECDCCQGPIQLRLTPPLQAPLENKKTSP